MSIHHVVTGPADAPLLVLGPSLGTSLRMWDPQLPALSERFRVLRYDHLGHGDSPVPDGPYTMDQLADEVLAIVGDERFHYAGLSLGGMVGMTIAARVPDRVDRLALLCTSAHLPPAEGWFDRASTVRQLGTPTLIDVMLTRWFTPEFTGTDRYAAMLAATPDEGYAGCCAAIATMDLRPVLGKITASTLVVSGSVDPAIPVDHGLRIAESVPGARFETVPAAHLANVERPAEITALLLHHLAGQRGGTT